jgi:hypothetical protein
MLGNNQPCSICSSEPIIKGCVCDNEIILLGIKCLSDHFIETTKDHNPVELDLALRMQADPSLVSLYLEQRVEIFMFLKVLREKLHNTKKLEEQYSSYKDIITSHIENIFNQFYREAEQISKDTHDKIKIISNYKATLSEEGKALIDSYKELGINKVFDNSIQSKTISIDEILKYILDVINSKNTYIEAEEYSQEEEHKSTLKIEDSQYNQEETLKAVSEQKDAEYMKDSQIPTKDTQEEDKHAEGENMASDTEVEKPQDKTKGKYQISEIEISKLNDYIQEIKSEMKSRNVEYKDRIGWEKRQITVAEICYRIAIFLWFAITMQANLAWTYGLTTFLIFTVLWNDLKNYLYQLNILKRKIDIVCNPSEPESSAEVEDNDYAKRAIKLRKILSKLDINDTEHENHVSHKDRQMVAFALHYGLAFITLTVFEGSKSIENIADIFMVAFLVTLLYGDLQILLIHSQASRREASIYNIKEEVEKLLTIESTNYIEYSNKLGELKCELKIHDEEHQNLASLKARKILSLQRSCARIIFIITPNTYDVICFMVLDILIAFLSSKDKVSKKIMRYLKDFTAKN